MNSEGLYQIQELYDYQFNVSGKEYHREVNGEKLIHCLGSSSTNSYKFTSHDSKYCNNFTR